jgi:hypothetical protein
MDLLDSRPVRDSSFVFRKVGEEYILVPVGGEAARTPRVYSLNSTSARIWELIDGTRTVRDVRDALTTEFDVTPSEALADLEEFLLQLRRMGAVAGT